MIWYDMIWYDMIWYDMIWYDMIWYDMIWYDMIWYDMIYDIRYDIFINCNWVATRWQQYSTHIHTNNIQNDTKQYIEQQKILFYNGITLSYIIFIYIQIIISLTFNPLNAELNPICHFLALLGAHHILYVSRIRVKNRMSYI